MGVFFVFEIKQDCACLSLRDTHTAEPCPSLCIVFNFSCFGPIILPTYQSPCLNCGLELRSTICLWGHSVSSELAVIASTPRCPDRSSAHARNKIHLHQKRKWKGGSHSLFDWLLGLLGRRKWCFCWPAGVEDGVAASSFKSKPKSQKNVWAVQVLLSLREMVTSSPYMEKSNQLQCFLPSLPLFG